MARCRICPMAQIHHNFDAGIPEWGGLRVFLAEKGAEMEERSLESISRELKRKSKKGLFNLVFSRMGLILLLFFLHLGIMFAVFRWLSASLLEVYGAAVVLAMVMVMVLLVSRSNPSVKVTWLIIIMVLPVFGALLYLYTRSDLGHRALDERLHQIARATTGQERPGAAAEKLRQDDAGVASLANYLHRKGFALYDNAAVTYFPSGEEKWRALLTELEKAEKFIFLEYFIISEGVMWQSVRNILERKAAEGVEVRLMYDGTCEFVHLPVGYWEELRKKGIKCKVFSPLRPFVSTHYNYRDHRKIAVIDGCVAFTGGVNLGDEYINVASRFGHWKDTAVMIRGKAADSFTRMFLQMWDLDEKRLSDYGKYLNCACRTPEEAKGFVVPYGDSPLDGDPVGERVYMDILNRAQRYVHIMTPYLILDGEMETALKFAAERGVDVKVILPGIPDKKIPYALAFTHYASLMDSGVKLYEYVPGFVHAKVFVCDDCEAAVGTVNLDYRSLYHHFECGAYCYKTDCIGDIEDDFSAMLPRCRQVTHQTLRKGRFWRKTVGFLCKGLAPLL